MQDYKITISQGSEVIRTVVIRAASSFEAMKQAVKEHCGVGVYKVSVTN